MTNVIKVTAALDAQNEFSSNDEGTVQAATGVLGAAIYGKFNLSISGTWVGTLTLQRSFDDGVTWVDVKTYVDNEEATDEESEMGVKYRIGFKTGEFTSGTANVRLSRA